MRLLQKLATLSNLFPKFQKSANRNFQVLITAGQALAQTTLEDYRAMVDDEQRTAAYAAAIQRRAKGATVADVGTGPFALLAVLAVKFGARKVYAIERTPEATMFEVCWSTILEKSDGNCLTCTDLQ